MGERQSSTEGDSPCLGRVCVWRDEVSCLVQIGIGRRVAKAKAMVPHIPRDKAKVDGDMITHG